MSDTEAGPLVVSLADDRADLELVGGKGTSLSRLATAGLPVPTGFHVTTEAYRRYVAIDGLQDRIMDAMAEVGDDLSGSAEHAAERIGKLFAARGIPADISDAIRAAYAGSGAAAVAVRSSATAEDLPDMSFAGQQETYLNIRGTAALLDAVRRCWASLWTARAIAYRARNGIAPQDVALAVVVQELVPADAAGVLFTADPVTGSADHMVINAAWGLGEAVVSGQVTADTVVVDPWTGATVEQQIGDKTVMTVRVPEGTTDQPVPPQLRDVAVLSAAQVAELADIGARIAELYSRPMDVEWAMRDGSVFVLQARPITGVAGAPDAWNDSLSGDFLWSNGNLGEAIPDVMTPCTWSLVQRFMSCVMATASLPGYVAYGRIGGRFYLNLSLMASISGSVGISMQRFKKLTEGIFGKLPAAMDIPPVPLSRWDVLRQTIPTAVTMARRVQANKRLFPAYFAASPARCDAMRERIARTDDPKQLRELWDAEVAPMFDTASYMLEATGRGDPRVMISLQGRLKKLVGEADANALSSVSGAGDALASLGPVLGLAQLAKGEIDAASYAQRYGHRSAHEFEVSIPRPAEQPGWLDRQLAEMTDTDQDPVELLGRQEKARAAAWERLAQRHPRKVRSTKRLLDRWVRAERGREQGRSEVVRVFWVLRAFVLRAGELTGHGEDLFCCAIQEILDVLDGDRTALSAVPTRKASYERYRSLPPYPTLIRGRFDPFRWAADPNRRSDLFDERGESTPAADTVTGFPGAAGVVEGIARVIANPDEGDQLKTGEILVTTVTNIGWTPLFPRVAAVVTDVGAPLSHAAIVARELGIPAVVGCGNATMRLHSGDRIRVDGEHGTVEVLTSAATVPAA